jgi:DNA mismatch repair protein MutL
VSDNGEGMSKEDAKESVQKHTTSKIKNAEDLFKIHSLGFRGEALSSIASVSEVEIITRTKNDTEGIDLELDQGIIKRQKPIGCPVGTSIKVKDLFYNTPARKKHLKEIAVELRYITEIVTRYALVHKIGFKLIHNSRLIINCPEKIDSLGRIINIYGKDFGKELMPIEAKTENIALSGYIGKPSLTRADKEGIVVYINSRFVKNRAITDAVCNSYNTLLGTQRFPVAILNIYVPEEKVDVNVHPTKIEVRLEKEHIVCSDIFDCIRQKLESNVLAPKIKPAELKQEQFGAVQQKQQVKEPEKYSPLDKKASKQAEIKIEPIKVEAPAYNVLGTIHKTFVIVETKDGLRIVDQHAAHERILYEQISESLKKDAPKKQALLQPIKIDVAPEDAILVSENLAVFESYGIKLEEFGRNTFLIRTLPSVLGSQMNQKMFLDLVSEIKNSKKKSADEFKEKMIKIMSCRAAEKAGDTIGTAELYTLLKQLEQCRQPYTCPHGRPTMIDFTITDLEKSFNRIRSEKDAKIN